jgi:hypothetical protein
MERTVVDINQNLRGDVGSSAVNMCWFKLLLEMGSSSRFCNGE